MSSTSKPKLYSILNKMINKHIKYRNEYMIKYMENGVEYTWINYHPVTIFGDRHFSYCTLPLSIQESFGDISHGSVFSSDRTISFQAKCFHIQVMSLICGASLYVDCATPNTLVIAPFRLAIWRHPSKIIQRSMQALQSDF